MPVKDYAIASLTGAGLIASGSADYIGFESGWIVILTDSTTDVRLAYSQAYPNMHRVRVTPNGVPYPGDTVPGNGPYKVTIDFQGTPATIVMNRVEDVTLDTAWCLITKGDNLIAYSSSIIYSVTLGPSDP